MTEQSLKGRCCRQRRFSEFRLFSSGIGTAGEASTQRICVGGFSVSWADPRKRATSSWFPLPGGGRAPGASPGQGASSGLLLSTLTFPSRLLRAVDGFPCLRISQHPEHKGHAAPDLEHQRQLSKLAQVGKGGPWAHPASRGEPRLESHPPPPAYRCSRLRKGTAQGVRPRTGRRLVAPGHLYLKASCPWQSFLLKVKIPFVCGKKPHKKKKKKSPTEKHVGFYL